MFERTKSSNAIKQLGAVALFSSCSNKELHQLARLTREEHVSAGTVIVRQGDLGSECHIIAHGSVCVEVNGARVTTLAEGESFGELSLLDHQPRSATVAALTDCVLLVLGTKEFATAIATTPSLTIRLLAELSGRIRAGNNAKVAA